MCITAASCMVQALKPLLVGLPPAEIEPVLLAWTPTFQRLVMDNVRRVSYPELAYQHCQDLSVEMSTACASPTFSDALQLQQQQHIRDVPASTHIVGTLKLHVFTLLVSHAMLQMVQPSRNGAGMCKWVHLMSLR